MTNTMCSMVQIIYHVVHKTCSNYYKILCVHRTKHLMSDNIIHWPYDMFCGPYEIRWWIIHHKHMLWTQQMLYMPWDMILIPNTELYVLFCFTNIVIISKHQQIWSEIYLLLRIDMDMIYAMVVMDDNSWCVGQKSYDDLFPRFVRSFEHVNKNHLRWMMQHTLLWRWVRRHKLLQQLKPILQTYLDGTCFTAHSTNVMVHTMCCVVPKTWQHLWSIQIGVWY